MTRITALPTLALATALVTGLAMGLAPAFGADSKDAASTIHVEQAVTIAAAPDIVWSTVRDYDSPGLWEPSITSAIINHGKDNKPGAKRHITLTGGGAIDDTLTAWSADKRMSATRIRRTTLPVRHYRDRITVEPAEHGSRLTWAARFQPAADAPPAKARQAISRRIKSALKRVKTMLGASDSEHQ